MEKYLIGHRRYSTNNALFHQITFLGDSDRYLWQKKRDFHTDSQANIPSFRLGKSYDTDAAAGTNWNDFARVSGELAGESHQYRVEKNSGIIS